MPRWPDITPFQRFETKFEKRSDQCWLWQGAPKLDIGGYGQFYYRGKYELAHRMSWAFYRNKGELPSLQVLHKCDVPLCVNPGHLFLGTQQDNVADMVRKDRTRKGGLPSWARLTPDIVRQIRDAEGTGNSREVGQRFGISKNYAGMIWQRKVWADVVC